MRALAVIKRISMDLNDNVVAIADSPQASLLFAWPYDVGEVAVVHAFCGSPRDVPDFPSRRALRRLPH
jgi:hypothetical protein